MCYAFQAVRLELRCMQGRMEAICIDLHNEEHLRKFRKHEKVVSHIILATQSTIMKAISTCPEPSCINKVPCCNR